MKISSASKKVLASALSAAMVVAFAPTVAFGAVSDGQTVTVKFDTTGLTLKDGNSALGDLSVTAAAVVGSDGFVKLNFGSDILSGHEYKDVTGWWFDANADGNATDDEKLTYAAVASSGKASLTFSTETNTDNGVITMKPIVADAIAVNGIPTKGSTIAQKAVASNSFLNLSFDSAGTYKVAVSKDGAQISSQTVVNGNSATFTFKATAAMQAGDTEKGLVDVATYGKGVYTVAIQDLTDSKKSVVKTFKIVELTIAGVFSDGSIKKANQTVLAIEDTNVGKVLNGAKTDNKIEVVADDKDVDGKKYAATGYYVNGVKVASITGGIMTGDETKDVKAADGMVLQTKYADEADVTATYANKAIDVKVGNLQTGATYRAVLSGAVTAQMDDKKITGTIATFNGLYDWGSAAPAAGDYVVSVYKVEGVGGSELTTKVAEQTVSIAVVALDAGDGELSDTTFKPTAIQTGKKFSDVYGTIKGVSKDTTQGFIGWSLDGTTLLKSTDKIAEGKAYTLKAVYSANRVAVPSFSYADGFLTLATDAGDGYKVLYSTDSLKWYDYTGAIKVDPKTPNVVYAKVVKKSPTAAGLADSYVLDLHSAGHGYYGTPVAQSANDLISNFVTNALGVIKTSDSTSAKPKYYSVELKAATDAAKKAIADVAYNTADGWNKALFAQEKAVVRAVADYEIARIDALAAGEVAADGTASKISDTTAAKAKADIEAVVADFAASYDADKATVPTKVRAAYGDYTADINKAASDAAKTAVKYAKADVDAAAAVTTQLKAAKTAADAKAALEAYGKLTATQKELVATADVAAAEAVVAAAAVKDAQDDAAVSKARNTSKTVKAGKNGKTTKKQSVTLKKITSKSGAKVTYKKVSGKKAITVKSGKAYLAKGVKKGTYKATVKATCGTQTAKIKVTFKVK